jgi:hypothetical protein
VSETSSDTISLNISSGLTLTSVTAKVNYNGTLYDSSVAPSGSIYVLSNTLDIPLVTSGNSELKNIFWNISLVSSGVTYNFLTSTFSQNVTIINVSLCDTVNNVPFVNITTVKEEATFPSLNSTFQTSWNIYSSSGTGVYYRNFTYSDLVEDNHTYDFCITPSDVNYTVDATFEADATGYAKNFYYLSSAEISNSTELITIPLLNDSLATLTQLIVKDQSQSGMEGVYITIQKYDVGTDTYYQVAQAKTNFEGKDVVYLNWYDTLYKFILVQSGTVIKSTEPYKVAETPQIFQIYDSPSYELDKFSDINYNLYYNSTTGNFVLTYILTSGLVTDACLKVTKRNITNDYVLCDTCEQSASATIYCNVAAYGNGTFIGTFYALGSYGFIDSIAVTIIDTSKQIYNELGNMNGTFYAIMLSGVIVSLFAISPAFAIVGLIVGVILSIALGFQPFDYYVLTGIVIVGGALIWFLKR